MMDLIKNIPAALKLTSTLGYLTIVIGSIFGIVFAGLWIKDCKDTITYNKKKLNWHHGLSYWKLAVAIVLISVAAAVLISAYNEIPRLRQ